jgi:Glycosyl hydrolase family 57
MNVFWLLPLLWLGMVGSVVFHYRRDVLAIWREPVLRYPVMIIESDDWGAGPVVAQAEALNQLVDVLSRYRDQDGRHPVMTLALVLAVPDGPAIREDGQYHRLPLDDPMFAPVRQAIERGRNAGVFALQLHGLEHYWPAGLMASTDPLVRAWLTDETPGATEMLPSHLQSRWVDASSLPSRPLAPAVVAEAVADEVRVYERMFGERPRVAVPPTFVWTADVERAWMHEGIEFVVTPGVRSACRDAVGMPACDKGPLYNGQLNDGVTYLVRNDYFEPERGHSWNSGLEALTRKTEEWRPCLLETHRSNFIFRPEKSERGYEQLNLLLSEAIKRYPALHFMTSEQLGQVLRESHPGWIAKALPLRMVACYTRLKANRRLWRSARLSGLAWATDLIYRLGQVLVIRNR